MKLNEFYAVVGGSIRYSLSEYDKPLCGRDFWGKYRDTDMWDAEISRAIFIPHGEIIVCLINLK